MESERFLSDKEREDLSKYNYNNEQPKQRDGQSSSTQQDSIVGKVKKKGVDSFVVHNKYGMGGNESEEEDDDIREKMADATPMTKRRINKEENLKKVKKLGPLATSFTIFKGFVCTGILYMPKDFINGGWLFSSACILVSLAATLYCSTLLLDCRAKYGGSFPEIG